MIVAGHETTAVALFWSLYLLAGAPQVQDRLAAEVAPLDLGPDHAAEMLTRLVYTRAVVHEALRLYPPAFTLARQAIAADTAGGVPIPRSTVVLISPWVLHRHRQLWSRPEIFDPDAVSARGAATRSVYLSAVRRSVRACASARNLRLPKRSWSWRP